MCRIRSNRLLKRVTTVPVTTLAAVSWWQIGCVFTALVAGVFTQLPGPGAALSRAAFAATASGDSVIRWNAHAGDAAMTKALQDHVKAVVAPYKYPRAIEYVADLPKTQTGKLQRFELRKKAAESAARKLAS